MAAIVNKVHKFKGRIFSSGGECRQVYDNAPEGLDRVGKSTQVDNVRNYINSLQNGGGSTRDALAVHFPDRKTPIGIKIDKYLRNKLELTDRDVHIMFADNRKERAADMKETLEKGTSLVVDRYAFSGVAFTTGKGVSGMDLNWCAKADEGALAPDLVIMLEADPDELGSRSGYGEERYEKVELQRRVASVFKQIPLRFPSLVGSRWVVVDALLPQAKVFEEIKPHVMRCFQERAQEPVKYLWDP